MRDGCGDDGEGSGPAWDDALGLVGDPVDVVSGAETHFETDFRLRSATPPLSWVRHYDSRRATVDRGLGPGFRLTIDAELAFDVDGLTFVDGRGIEIAFPFPSHDGQRILREAHTLERMGPLRYRVHRPADSPTFEFEFRRDLLKPARPTAMIGDHGRGRTARLSYDERGLRSVTFSDRTRLAVEWDGSRLASVVLSDGDGHDKLLVRYTYDRVGRLSEAENAYHHVLRYEYDAAGRLARKIDRRGYSFHFSYDPDGRCIHTRGEDGVEEFRFEYKPLERLTIVKRGDGAVWQYTYDEQGSIVQVIDPYGGLTSYLKGEDGRVAKEVDPNGNQSEIIYNGLGVPFARRDPLGHLQRLPVNSTPHPLSHDLPPTPATWSFGRLHLTGRRADAAAIDRALPPWVLGTVGPTPEAPLHPSTIERDVQGVPLREERGDGKTRRWGLDANGYDRWRTDFDGHTTRYEYASWNHLVRIEEPLGRVTQMGYTLAEKPAMVVDSLGTRTDFRYDLKDRLVEVHRNGRVRESYRYDAADNLVEKHAGAGDGESILKLTVGPGNVLKQRQLASGDLQDFTRDERGRIVATQSVAGACTFAYDTLGRQIRDERDGMGVRHERRDGRTDTTTVLGRFTIEYVTVEDGVTTLVRDAADQVQRLRRLGTGLVERSCSNGVRELVHYDLDGRCLLKAVEGRTLGVEGWARRFSYSAEGDLLRREDSARGRTSYQHDDAHRLGSVQEPNGDEQRYVYDRADNLLDAPGLAASTQAGNKLLVANGDRFEYDKRDNVAVRDGTAGEIRYTYDSRGQLVAADGPGLEYRAKHDPLGRRTEKIVNGKTWTYYWDDDRLAAEVFPDGQLRIYVYPDPVALVPILFIDYDGVDADPRNGRRSHVFTDHLGCPELVLDDQGRTIWRARILPYGTALVDGGEDFHQPLRWPGHYFDAETGLHENRFRSYSPELGRYLQSDPIGIAGGLNVYAYTSNPLRTVDLNGLGTICEDDPKNCPLKKKEGEDQEGAPVGPDGKPQRLSREDGQAAADLLHEQAAGKANLSVTTVTELPDGRLVVTTSADNLSSGQRDGARALLGPDVIMPDTKGAPGYQPSAAARSLPGEFTGSHGEGKGIQAARQATGTPDGAPSPPTRQWSSSGAEHQGSACQKGPAGGCEGMQGRNNVTNETGVQSGAQKPGNPSGRFDGGKK